MTNREYLDYVLAYHARFNRNAENFRNWLQVSPTQKLDITVRDAAWDIMAEIKKSL